MSEKLALSKYVWKGERVPEEQVRRLVVNEALELLAERQSAGDERARHLLSVAFRVGMLKAVVKTPMGWDVAVIPVVKKCVDCEGVGILREVGCEFRCEHCDGDGEREIRLSDVQEGQGK